MSDKLKEIGERIKELRGIFDIESSEVAKRINISEKEYLEYENGTKDFSFTFMYNLSKVFNVDITELFTGQSPKLKRYCVIRKDESLPMKKENGFTYQHLAFLVKDKIAEPFFVTAPYDEEADKLPLQLNYHEGQEFNYVLEGQLKFRIDNTEFILNPGDCVYYDSSHGHGNAATGGADCKFLAIVMKYTEKGE